MAKIETDIGINVGIENAPAPQDGNITTATSQIVGKNSFQELASIFATINPAIKDLAQNERCIISTKIKKINYGDF